MHLRIYLWLSCVVLAGYVRAQEDGGAGAVPTVDTAAPPQNDGPLASDHDAFLDDEGSGLEGDESSGSGWGAGPGPDDEDARGSGDEGPEDDEDYKPVTVRPTAAPTTPEPELFVPDYSTEAPFLPFDVVSPRIITGKESIEAEEEGRSAGAETPSRPDDISISGEDTNSGIQDPDKEHEGAESRPADNVVFIMNAKPEDRATSFFAQPGILAAVIGGAVVGLLCAILVVMFIVYRMRKKDEGSYALDEPKRSPAAASYGKGHNNREFYA
ncbi:syndecan isoform X1 [Pectinophora gossypiella]|uniref:syndecan isoform X1 n=1 Tax=Pectinophora gossypiella TaxID=13191 RepID=UPI00214E13BB|nr:syndecan isoform X1 [Pectinophora gossypiella]